MKKAKEALAKVAEKIEKDVKKEEVKNVME